MDRKLLEQLWELRFKKMWEGEKDALFFYKGLLKKNEDLLADCGAREILEGIMKDEAKHMRIAHKLWIFAKSKQQRRLRKTV